MNNNYILYGIPECGVAYADEKSPVQIMMPDYEKQNNFLIMDNPVEDEEYLGEDFEEDEDCFKRTITKEEFDSKFKEVIDLAKYAASDKVKGFKFVKMDTHAMNDVIAKYYINENGYYSGVSINDTGILMVKRPNSEFYDFDTDTETASGQCIDDNELNNPGKGAIESAEEITEDEFIKEFSERIKLTEEMIHRD